MLADEAVTSLSSAGAVLWTLADHQGTVRDLAEYDSGLDSTSIANHRVYNAFGELVSETDDAVDHLFAYTGRERDDETGLQYHRARYYDPALGRWFGEDPIRFAAGDANLTRMVGNNPVSYFSLMVRQISVDFDLFTIRLPLPRELRTLVALGVLACVFPICVAASPPASESQGYIGRAIEEARYQDAITALTAVLKCNAAADESRLLRAECHFQLRDYVAAIDDLNHIKILNCGKDRMLKLKADCLIAVGDYEAATQLLESACRTFPDDENFRYRLLRIRKSKRRETGNVLIGAGDLKGAQRWLKHEIIQNPSDARLRSDYANCLAQAGFDEHAIAAMKQSIELAATREKRHEIAHSPTDEHDREGVASSRLLLAAIGTKDVFNADNPLHSYAASYLSKSIHGFPVRFGGVMAKDVPNHILVRHAFDEDSSWEIFVRKPKDAETEMVWSNLIAEFLKIDQRLACAKMNILASQGAISRENYIRGWTEVYWKAECDARDFYVFEYFPYSKSHRIASRAVNWFFDAPLCKDDIVYSASNERYPIREFGERFDSIKRDHRL